jgi:predicted TIM-barrel fold metal-dependent hydrolase
VSTKRARAERVDRIRIVGNLDPHDAEALQLELLRLAKRFGRIKDLRVEMSTAKPDGRSA